MFSLADAPLSSPVHLATAAQNLAKPSMASRSRVEDVWAGAIGMVVTSDTIEALEHGTAITWSRGLNGLKPRSCMAMTKRSQRLSDFKVFILRQSNVVIKCN